MPRTVKEVYPEGWKEQYDRISRLARKLGVRLCKRVAADSAQWNGRSIALYGFEGERLSPSELIHEIAHWLCASPARRRLYDYGLGSGNFSNMAVRRVDGIDDDEEQASLLGILFERAFAMNWEQTWEDHNWAGHNRWAELGECSWEGYSNFWCTLATLYKRRLVRLNGTPRTLFSPCV